MTFDSRMTDTLAELLIDDLASGAGRDPTLDQISEDDVRGFENAIGAVSLVYAAADTGAMPAGLRERCAGAARGVHSASAVPQASPASSPGPLRFTPQPEIVTRRSSAGSFGWLAAAACLAFAAVAWWPSSPAALPTAEQQMVQLVRTAPDLSRWDWQAWDPELEGIVGEVVWSEAAQEGYMVLEGLAANDPSEEQYQLWVVESSRGTPLEVPPVDGGVFNVPSSGKLVIPIRCAIPARDVVAFAVTREPPGGVVVSDRSRKVVIAQPPAEG